MHPCPLCASQITPLYFQDKLRDYFQCSQCQLVFADPKHYLEAAAEKAVYDLHENLPYDAGYRCFLSRLATPLLERLAPNSNGLDFGCGPGPALALMLQEQGHNVELYDLYFYSDRAVLDKRYQFICATEVIEHLYQPAKVWQCWLNMLQPDGWLGIMTKMVKDVDAFSHWHYKSDPTHVIFFSRATFEFLAKRDHLQFEFIGNDVVLLKNTPPCLA